MLATESSNPHATNVVIGKTVATLLSVTLRAPMHNQTARQTSTLQRTPRARAETGSSAILLRDLDHRLPDGAVAHGVHAGQPY